MGMKQTAQTYSEATLGMERIEFVTRVTES